MSKTTASLPGALGAQAPWFGAARTTRGLAAVWAGLLLLRLALLGRGTLVDYDERRYFQSFEALKAAAHGDWQACAYALSMVDARPVDALWRCLPAAGQLLLARYTGWDIYAFPSLLLPTLLNWAATALVAWFFLRVCQLLFASIPAAKQWALVAAVLYASLVNTSIYVRHVLPYDAALLLFMWLFYWVLCKPARPSSWFWGKLGVGAGLLWLCYPGYYAGPVLLVLPLLNWQRPLSWVLAHLGQLVALGVGFILPLAAAEALSRFGGAPPFWAVSYDLSLHILQGDPAEGYTFWLKYLWQVEGTLGMVLVALLLLAGWQAGQRIGRTGLAALVPHTQYQKLMVGALLLFLVHATAAAVGHRIVWYGRLLHLYMPFLVLAGVHALATSRQQGRAALLALASCAVGVVSYILFFVSYQRIAYPTDTIVAYHLNCLPARQLRYCEEVRVPAGLRFLAQGPRAAAPVQCSPQPVDSLTILVNFALLYPPNAATRTVVPSFGPAARVVFDGPHYRAFPAYDFEGLTPAERAETRRRRYRLRVLRVATASAKARLALPLRQP
ncbi:MAG: hypothetical protein ACRYFZ_00350 [Janthinobacterium lividum]